MEGEGIVWKGRELCGRERKRTVWNRKEGNCVKWKGRELCGREGNCVEGKGRALHGMKRKGTE